jgi:hypothetical protein
LIKIAKNAIFIIDYGGLYEKVIGQKCLFCTFFGILLSCASTPEPEPEPVRRVPQTILGNFAGQDQTEVYITRSDNHKKNNIGYISVFLNGSLQAEVACGGVEKILVPNGFHEISVNYNGYTGSTKPILFNANGNRLDFRTGIYNSGKSTYFSFIQEGVKKFNYEEICAGQTLRNVSKNSKIAIVYITDERIDSKGNPYNDKVIENIAGDLEIFWINNGYTIVDRSQLDKLRQEHNFQMSGEVDDATAVSIGKFAGADIIITGRFSSPRDLYYSYLRLRAINTQSAQVIGAASSNSGQ